MSIHSYDNTICYAPYEHLSKSAVRLAILELFRVGQLQKRKIPMSESLLVQSTKERRTWRFMYPSVLTKNPLYSNPHLSLTYTGLPVSSCMNGFGLTGLTCTTKQPTSAHASTS